MIHVGDDRHVPQIGTARRPQLGYRHGRTILSDSLARPARRLGKEVEHQPVKPLWLFHLRRMSTVIEDNDLSARKLVFRRLGMARWKDMVVPAPDQERRHAQLGEPALDADAA